MVNNSQQQSIENWYTGHIAPKELDKKVTATIDYVARFNTPENGKWRIWAHEITTGAHGSNTMGVFLIEVLDIMPFGQDSEEFDELCKDLDQLVSLFDDVSESLAKEFNRHTDLIGKFTVEVNEADGSIGAFYTVKA